MYVRVSTSHKAITRCLNKYNIQRRDGELLHSRSHNNHTHHRREPRFSDVVMEAFSSFPVPEAAVMGISHLQIDTTAHPHYTHTHHSPHTHCTQHHTPSHSHSIVSCIVGVKVLITVVMVLVMVLVLRILRTTTIITASI